MLAQGHGPTECLSTQIALVAMTVEAPSGRMNAPPSGEVPGKETVGVLAMDKVV